MNLYHNTLTNELGLTLDEVRQRLPHCSIPDNTASVHDFVAYQTTTPPSLGWNQRLVEVAPLDGVQAWQVATVSAEEERSLTNAQQASVRQRRTQLLKDSDWTQLPDVSMNNEQVDAWRSYRQQLRDVTSQLGYPWTINWPDAPVA